MSAPEPWIVCQWFARCDRLADGVVRHPVLGRVPTCERCARLAGAELLPWRHDRKATA